MTRPIEPRSPGPLANTLTAGPYIYSGRDMGGFKYICIHREVKGCVVLNWKAGDKFEKGKKS